MQKYNITIGLIVTVLLLMGANIVLFARTVVISDTISRLEQHKVGLERQNERLRVDLYELKSYEKVSAYAESLGFTQKATALNLETSGVAMAQ
ncbi:MAG: Cell division protein FtsL [Microgenomates bacterium OLB22]|nr:MAG: Cell division protein FtsL [Microgenomates bacterium OLB22]